MHLNLLHLDIFIKGIEEDYMLGEKQGRQFQVIELDKLKIPISLLSWLFFNSLSHAVKLDSKMFYCKVHKSFNNIVEAVQCIVPLSKI